MLKKDMLLIRVLQLPSVELLILPPPGFLWADCTVFLMTDMLKANALLIPHLLHPPPEEL